MSWRDVTKTSTGDHAEIARIMSALDDRHKSLDARMVQRWVEVSCQHCFLFDSGNVVKLVLLCRDHGRGKCPEVQMLGWRFGDLTRPTDDEMQLLCSQVLLKLQLWVNSLADVPNMARTYVPKNKSGAMGVVYSALEVVLESSHMLTSAVETDDAIVWHVSGISSN